MSKHKLTSYSGPAEVAALGRGLRNAFWDAEAKRRTKAEIDFEDTGPLTRRNENEHPEPAYRRGYQQGAMTVLAGLRSANLLDPWTREQLEHFVGIEIYKWRYSKRKLKREFIRDQAPEFNLLGGQARVAKKGRRA